MCLGGEEEAEKCDVDLLLGRAHPGHRLRGHLLDPRHRELPQPQRADGWRQGGAQQGGGGGRELLVDDTWTGRGTGRHLCGSSLVVLPNNLGKTAGQEEEEPAWISTNPGSEQDRSLKLDKMTEKKTSFRQMNLLGNRYRLRGTIMASKRVYFILSSFHANKHYETYYKQT